MRLVAHVGVIRDPVVAGELRDIPEATVVCPVVKLDLGMPFGIPEHLAGLLQLRVSTVVLGACVVTQQLLERQFVGFGQRGVVRSHG
ncbi:MAG: hypothetical protein A3F93_02400 [Candidatus Magasanikbacteria bacterium RIFCSPLOWO2_12_FULL_34_7]|nr:MAG: hypothetical protein A3F93_02400 [Candidatus Magasanikbacteria bacterium RIFCSPLOWO2_12_FULL_34_7]